MKAHGQAAHQGQVFRALPFAHPVFVLSEGYILGFNATDTGSNKRELVVELKYFDGRPVIDQIRRVSKSGLRIYRGKEALPKIQGGLGIAIVSTPAGVMSDRDARAGGHGGEVLCIVS